MRKPGFIRDEILIVLGVLIAGFGGLALLGFALDPDDFHLGGFVFSVGLVAVGVTAFWIGLRFRRMERQLRRLLEVLRSVDSCGLRDVARNAQVSEAEARKGILFLISHGFVALRFDPAQNRVYAPQSRDGGGQKWATLSGTCSHCDAPAPVLVPAGQEPRCEYCDAPLPVKPVPVGARAGDQLPPPRGATQLSGTMFAGNWAVLILLVFFFWPAAIWYVTQNLQGRGGGRSSYH